jgi:hypothetical protein
VKCKEVNNEDRSVRHIDCGGERPYAECVTKGEVSIDNLTWSADAAPSQLAAQASLLSPSSLATIPISSWTCFSADSSQQHWTLIPNLVYCYNEVRVIKCDVSGTKASSWAG